MKIYRPHAIPILGALLSTALAGQISSSEHLSRVKIIMMNSFGEELGESAHVHLDGASFVGASISKDLIIRDRESVQLPDGRYTLTCYGSSSTVAVRSFALHGRDAQVLCSPALALPSQVLGAGQITPWVLRGKVQPRPPGPLVLIRAVGIFSNVTSETEINADGAFSLDVFDQGKYLVMVLANGELLHQEEILIEAAIPQRVDLGIIVPRPASVPRN